jgi:predicted metalloprotease with PDZ domain
MRFVFPLLLLVLVGAAPARVDRTVDYRLAPMMNGGSIDALAVTIHFHGASSGTTRLAWNDEWAGETKLAQWSRDLTVEGATSVEQRPGGARIIHAAPDAPLTVRYRIVSGFAGDPDVRTSRQPVPVVRPGWFYAVGEALFAVPDGDSRRPARFAWTGPAAIGFASDLQHGDGRTTLDGIVESVVIGGADLHVATSGPAGAQVRVARLGHYAFDTGVFDALALKVIAAERDFWRDRRPGPFLVTMAPVTAMAGQVSYSGTGRSDAFALWMDTSAQSDGLTWLLAHEYFHSWNSRRLGEPAPAPDMPRGYWFSEGFTDFYARRLMLRAGLISPQAFADQWNEMFARYAGSPFRAAPNEEVAAKFWSDEQADAMQYQRGALLAARWDRQLRAMGVAGGLDTVIRAQAARLTALRRKPQATQLFADTARTFGLDVRPDIAAHVTRGEPLLLAVDSFGPCARVVTAERPVFARGWDAEATSAAGNVVTGLDPASAAYAAGLRNGMTIEERLAGKPDDARVDYALRVDDAGKERIIRFRPAGRKRRTAQELVLDAAALSRAPQACRRGLAG